jgi:hypothetical protein
MLNVNNLWFWTEIFRMGQFGKVFFFSKKPSRISCEICLRSSESRISRHYLIYLVPWFWQSSGAWFGLHWLLWSFSGNVAWIVFMQFQTLDQTT